MLSIWINFHQASKLSRYIKIYNISNFFKRKYTLFQIFAFSTPKKKHMTFFSHSFRLENQKYHFSGGALIWGHAEQLQLHRGPIIWFPVPEAVGPPNKLQRSSWGSMWQPFVWNELKWCIPEFIGSLFLITSEFVCSACILSVALRCDLPSFGWVVTWNQTSLVCVAWWHGQ